MIEDLINGRVAEETKPTRASVLREWHGIDFQKDELGILVKSNSRFDFEVRSFGYMKRWVVSANDDDGKRYALTIDSKAGDPEDVWRINLLEVGEGGEMKNVLGNENWAQGGIRSDRILPHEWALIDKTHCLAAARHLSSQTESRQYWYDYQRNVQMMTDSQPGLSPEQILLANEKYKTLAMEKSVVEEGTADLAKISLVLHDCSEKAWRVDMEDYLGMRSGRIHEAKIRETMKMWSHGDVELFSPGNVWFWDLPESVAPVAVVKGKVSSEENALAFVMVVEGMDQGPLALVD